MERSTAPLHHQSLPFYTFRSRNFHATLPFSSHYSLLPTKPPNSLSSSSSSLLSPSQPQPPRFRITRVSTAPVEFAPPAPDFDFHQELARLRALRTDLSSSKTLSGKIRVVDRDSRVKRFFNSPRSNGLSRVVLESINMDMYELFLLKCVVAAGQEHVLGGSDTGTEESVDQSEFGSGRDSLKSALYALAEMIENWDGGGNGSIFREKVGHDEEISALRTLLKNLGQVEEFYNCIGGIIGFVLCLSIFLS